MAKIAVGSKIRFSHPTSNGGTLTFTAKVVKIAGDLAWVEIPERVRLVPFPPVGGKRYAAYAVSKLAAR